ncbi:MAG: BLUF domain-containing protein [Oceanicaulis sp.]
MVDACLYFSRADGATDPIAVRERLAGIAAQSRPNNTADEITGVLAGSRDAYLQLVEGPRGALSRLLERIYRDERHDGVVLARYWTPGERLFANWAMTPIQPEKRADLVFDYAALRAMDADALMKRLIELAALSGASDPAPIDIDEDVVRL